MSIRHLTASLAALVAVAAAAGGSIAATSKVKPAAATRQARTSPFLLGVMDDALLQYQPTIAFGALAGLKPKVIRFDVDWPTVAPKRPAHPTNPSDPAYNWTVVDNVVTRAAAVHIQVMLQVNATPSWAGPSYKDAWTKTTYHNAKPTRIADLQNFAFAAAKRYSGTFTPTGASAPLPVVTRWEAWNEPNTMVHLWPQYLCENNHPCDPSHPHKHVVAVAPRSYASILNAIYAGIHAAGKAAGITETVAGGSTKPSGNGPFSSEPSIAPLKFLRMMAPYHPHFDVYSHHPYRIGAKDVPSTLDNVGIDGIPQLLRTLDRYWPAKHYHIWLTEYGVQTNPPDKLVGVSLSAQSKALSHAVAVARANSRVDMMIWFLIRDEALHDTIVYGGFQTGLAFVNGKLKPAWVTFQRLARQ